ncbi:PREDICTED: cytochrome b561 domain-containing protein At4g18260-like [Erythranthe guttata]|nr:PREDICTED: cytochrome b561 domain-containing protein At4g18260-like [Erythranthe guttata]|eukprot:XP_012830501.1 PREDICTED: cytochrome b561 domain-containing protein At4g18260-like [Erythranthe guttata]
MTPVCISCLTALSFLLQVVECSSYKQSEAKNHPKISIDEKHINSQKTYEIEVHGILLWASMGLLMPIGILTMRISTSTTDFPPSKHKILIYVHAVLQVVSVVITTVGAVLSMIKFENAFDNSHQRIGLALYAAVYLQVLIGFRRPKRGSRGRSAWYLLHWLLGTTICLVGILNVYTGLQAYRKRTSKSTTLWTVVFAAQVSFMAIFYLFQDKWDYIIRQGVIIISPGCDPENSQAQLEKQVKDVVIVNEPCRKSNSLGTYFSRTNALNKLFQLT